MSQDLRLYSLSLIFALMLLGTPGRAAEYGDGTTGCPFLAVPVDLTGDDVWASYDDEGYSMDDYRELWPQSASVSVDGDFDNGCTMDVGAGTYYDGANHLWVLDDDLTCYTEDGYGGGDFRGGDRDY